MLKNRFSNILDTSKRRKGTISLLIATLCIVVSGLLVACTPKNHNEKNLNQNTNQPIDNPKKEDKKNVEDLTNNDTEDTFTVPYENNLLGFSLKLPEDWVNLIGIKENYVEYSQDGGAGIEVYHIATREAQPDKGTLFYIDRWMGTWTESNPPLPTDQNSIILQTDKYTYMLRTPNDIQYNEEDANMKESYNSMRPQIDIIKTSVKALNSHPSTPNAGYQTEAEFLSSPEGIQFRTTAYGAAKAVLTGDIDQLKNHLVNSSDATKFTNSFSDYQVDLIKFQCQFNLDAIKSDHKIVTSYEFTPVGKETNMYVSMELKKVNDEWLVDWLGVEQ